MKCLRSMDEWWRQTVEMRRTPTAARECSSARRIYKSQVNKNESQMNNRKTYSKWGPLQACARSRPEKATRKQLNLITNQRSGGRNPKSTYINVPAGSWTETMSDRLRNDPLAEDFSSFKDLVASQDHTIFHTNWIYSCNLELCL